MGGVGSHPLRDGVFAGAIASNSLHQFPDPERAMVEIARALRPGGVFVAYDPRYLPPCEVVKKRIRRNDPSFCPLGLMLAGRAIKH